MWELKQITQEKKKKYDFSGYLQAERTKLESNTNSIISVYFYDSGVSGNYR